MKAMRIRISLLVAILLALLSSIPGKSTPPLPKPVAHPLSQYKHKQGRSKGKGMPHFFQVKK